MIEFIGPLYNLLQHFTDYFDWILSTSDFELNCQLLWASRYMASGRTPRKTRRVLYALPNNGPFIKNLSPREGVYRAVA
jgi:hypothetical protein